MTKMDQQLPQVKTEGGSDYRGTDWEIWSLHLNCGGGYTKLIELYTKKVNSMYGKLKTEISFRKRMHFFFS